MQYAVQFAPVVQVGLSRSILACITGGPMIVLPGIWDVAPWNRASRKVSRDKTKCRMCSVYVVWWFGLDKNLYGPVLEHHKIPIMSLYLF